MLLGIDVGATTIKVGLYDLKYQLIQKDVYPTKLENDDFFTNLVKIIQQYQNITNIGIGLPGFVYADGYIDKLTNIGLENFNIIVQLKKIFDIDIQVENDANCATIAYQYLNNLDQCNIMVLTLGTGLGAGIIYNQNLLQGKHKMAAEIGHLPITLNEQYNFRCSCSKTNCLETIVSSNGITNLFENYKNMYQDSILLESNIDGYNLYKAVLLNDKLAIKIANIQALALAKAVNQVNIVLDLDCFVLAGGIANNNSYLLKKVKEYYKKESLKQYHDLEIVLANNDQLGMLGAALLNERNE